MSHTPDGAPIADDGRPITFAFLDGEGVPLALYADPECSVPSPNPAPFGAVVHIPDAGMYPTARFRIGPDVLAENPARCFLRF
jgi:hypothetical protein